MSGIPNIRVTMTATFFLCGMLVCGGCDCGSSAPAANATATPATAASASPDAGAKTLTIADKNRVAAPKEEEVILLLDFFPNKAELTQAGPGATSLIVATSTKYAEQYLAKPEYAKIPKANVYVVFVDSMDEYNRQNFSGMKRFGTLTYTRTGNQVILTENKLDFAP